MTWTRRSRAQLPFAFPVTPMVNNHTSSFLARPRRSDRMSRNQPHRISSGVQGLIGMGGDIRHAADYGMLWAEAKIAEKLGKLPPGQTADDVIAQYHGSAGRAFM